MARTRKTVKHRTRIKKKEKTISIERKLKSTRRNCNSVKRRMCEEETAIYTKHKTEKYEENRKMKNKTC
jgi:hypothetical protein